MPHPTRSRLHTRLHPPSAVLLALTAASFLFAGGETAAVALALPAFPGAMGYGAASIGGRGGRVIEVTNLDDSGPGSLRAAIEASGPRTVVFRIAGIITVNGSIDLRNPYITIAGQTAPGGGITLRGTTDHILRIKDTHDVIIRYLRFRNGSGDPGDNDNINIRGSWNVIIDHVSMSWATDENVGIWRDTTTSPLVHGITIQRSIFAEGLAGHSKGMQISGEKDYSDPLNPMEAWRGVSQISLHHNLFLHNQERNPRVISLGTEVINNVVYNWERRIGETQSASVIDYIGNYYVAGPMSRADRLLMHEDCSPDHPEWVCPLPIPSIYITGNVALPMFPDPAADNWNLVKYNFTYTPLPLLFRRLVRLPQGNIPVRVQSAAQAYASVVANVGANARLNARGHRLSNLDAVDARLLADVVNRTGPTTPITGPDEVGGYPAVDAGTPVTDSDHDGVPDAYESSRGWNPFDVGDGALDADGNGYSNLEEYLNGRRPLRSRR
jgi:pectate lyase